MAYPEPHYTVFGETTTTELSISQELKIQSGSNEVVDLVQLSSGSVTVSNSLVTPNSIIFLTKQTYSHLSAPNVFSKSNGSFVIKTSINIDDDYVAYMIVNPAV